MSLAQGELLAAKDLIVINDSMMIIMIMMRLAQGVLLAANHCYDIYFHDRFDYDDNNAIMMAMTMIFMVMVMVMLMLMLMMVMVKMMMRYLRKQEPSFP